MQMVDIFGMSMAEGGAVVSSVTHSITAGNIQKSTLSLLQLLAHDAQRAACQVSTHL
jgi:hypothetical protein